MRLLKAVFKIIPLLTAAAYPLFLLIGLLGADSLIGATYAMAQMLFVLIAAGGFSKVFGAVLLGVTLFVYLFPLVSLIVCRKRPSRLLLIATAALFILDAVWAAILTAASGGWPLLVLTLDLLSVIGCLRTALWKNA